MSTRCPLSPEARKQILKVPSDGYTQFMIAGHVRVHRHGVAKVTARSAETTQAELREQIARLKAELAARDAEVAQLRRLVVPAVQVGQRVAEGLAPRWLASADERLALSLATPPSGAIPAHFDLHFTSAPPVHVSTMPRLSTWMVHSCLSLVTHCAF